MQTTPVTSRLSTGRVLKSSNLLRALVLLPLVTTCACKTTSHSSIAGAKPSFEVVSATVDVDNDDGTPLAELSAHIYRPQHSVGFTVVMVPGGGRASKNGERSGNGTRSYDDVIPFTKNFAESFASAELTVLTYDKRTCTQKEDSACNENPRDDLDKLGPVALARDVDAACELATSEGNPLVLFAHGQAVQVALSSRCANVAAAFVFVGPIPDAIDDVIVRGLNRRATLLRKWGDKEAKSNVDTVRRAGEQKIEESLKLKNRAANMRDTFALLRKKKFEEDARVLGAPPSFWEGWIALTSSTPSLLSAVHVPVVVAMGQLDSQYAPVDKLRIEKMASEKANFVVVTGTDHYLMRDTKFDRASHTPVIEALLRALAAPPNVTPGA